MQEVEVTEEVETVWNLQYLLRYRRRNVESAQFLVLGNSRRTAPLGGTGPSTGLEAFGKIGFTTVERKRDRWK